MLCVFFITVGKKAVLLFTKKTLKGTEEIDNSTLIYTYLILNIYNLSFLEMSGKERISIKKPR